MSLQTCNDDVFGPVVKGCRGDYDFTLFFEQIVFELTLSLIIAVMCLIRIFFLFQQTKKTASGPLLYSKLVNVFALFGSQIWLIVCWSGVTKAHNAVYAITGSITLLNLMLIATVSALEHQRTIKPSDTLLYCLLALLTADIIQARTLWMKEGHQSVAGAMTAKVTFTLVSLVLESWGKDLWVSSLFKNAPREMAIGLFNRMSFWWLNPLLGKGYRRAIDSPDLGKMDLRLEMEALSEKPESNFAKRLMKHDSVYWALLYQLRRQLLTTIPPRIFLGAFNLSQPFLIHSAIDYVSATSVSQDTGYGLIGGAAFIYFGIAFSTGMYKHQVYRSIVAMRGVLTTMIYDATLEMPNDAIDETAALTLMNTDIERIAFGMQYMHEIWASTIEVSIAIYLLERQVGVASVVPGIIVIVSSVLVFQIGKMIRARQRSWNGAVETRVSETTELLGMIRGAKLTGMMKYCFQRIQQLRINELEICKGFRRLQVAKNVLANSADLAAPVLTFAVLYAVRRESGEPVLETSQAFTTLAIIQLVSHPMRVVINAFPAFTACLGCIDRISDYVNGSRNKSKPLDPIPQLLLGMQAPALSLDSFPSLRDSLAASNTDFKRSLPSSSQTTFGSEESKENYVVRSHEFQKLPIVFMKELSVAATRNGPTLLLNLDVSIQPGTTTVVVGPIGSGKSILLKAILGELSIQKGSFVRSTDSVAFCEQDPWLQNGTIRENIVCGALKDQKWYDTVTEVCGLSADIRRLPQTDETNIGSKGAKLSGGQKQRLALARAVYARRQLILLDDVFSGLDPSLQQFVFSRLLGPSGLLKGLGSTVIFATHAADLAQYCDYVIELNEGGQIAKQGKPVEQEVLKFPLVTETALEPNADEDQPTAVTVKASKETLESTEKQDQALDNARRMGEWPVYWYYIRSMDYRYALAFILLFAVETFFEKFPQVWLNLFTTVESHHPGEYTSIYFGVYGLFSFLGLFTLGVTIWFWFVIILPKSANNIHRALLDAVQSAPIWFFTSTDIGTIINRFSQDMELVDMALPLAFFQTTFGVLTCLTTIILISTGGSFIAVLIPFTLIFVYLLQTFYLRTSRQLRLLDLEARSPLYTHFLETIQGLVTIRAFGWHASFREVNNKHLSASQKPFYMLYCVQRWLNFVLDIFVAILAVVVIAMATQLRGKTGGTNGAALGLSLVNILGFNVSLAELIDAWTIMETSLGSVSRVKAFVKTTPKDLEPVEEAKMPVSWPSQGTIEFRDVTCSYQPDGPAILKNLTFTVERGQKLGLCGRSGGGKSSVILALLNLLHFHSGTIIIDGLPIDSLTRSTLANAIIVLPQDSFLRAGTVRCNLDPHGVHSDVALQATLQKVSLLPVVQGSKQGLDVHLKDLALSAGQRQLLALAVALLRATVGRDGQTDSTSGGILVLDEATSHVDLETEILIRRVVKEEFTDQRWTVLEVSHSIKGIRDADVVAVMEAGRIVNFCSPDEFLAGEEAGAIFNSTAH